MNVNKKNLILIGGAIIFKDHRGRRKFLLVAQKEGDGWEIPKVTVRKGESSVRSVIRMTGEQAGMDAKVLEEAGRINGFATVGEKSIPQRQLYYLMVQRSGGEIVGFDKFEWLEYDKASRRVTLKREKDMLKNAKNVLKEWEKTHKL